MSQNDLTEALATPSIVERFLNKILFTETCWVWTGAISGAGHGRFWVKDGFVVVAHRFAWGLHFGTPLPKIVCHSCDNPLCQHPEHLQAGSGELNRREYLARVGQPGSALNDVRGSAGRARAIRDCARSGGDLDRAAEEGLSLLDLYQDPLPIAIE